MKWFEEHPYATVGGIAGGLLAIAGFTLGFWKTFVTLALIVGGASLAQYLYKNGKINFKK